MTFDTPFTPSAEANDKQPLSHRKELLRESTGGRYPDCQARDIRAQGLEVGPSDEFLIEQLRHGNHDALAVIFRRYARMVRSVAYRIVRDEAEAEDLLQEVFLFIFRKWSLFDSVRGSARSWIVQVTYHRAIDRRRHLASRRFYTSSELDETLIANDEPMTDTTFYERSIEGVLGVETLKRIEEELSDDQRRTIQLYFFDGYTFEEIAERTGQTVGNIRNHYYRGLERIRRLIFPGALRGK
ncbi:MAG TPA: sigma-70 family RNA polymerase sigma factor [Terracidiphilus sp.]